MIWVVSGFLHSSMVILCRIVMWLNQVNASKCFSCEPSSQKEQHRPYRPLPWMHYMYNGDYWQFAHGKQQCSALFVPAVSVQAKGFLLKVFWNPETREGKSSFESRQISAVHGWPKVTALVWYTMISQFLPLVACPFCVTNGRTGTFG